MYRILIDYTFTIECHDLEDGIHQWHENCHELKSLGNWRTSVQLQQFISETNVWRTIKK